MMFYKDTKIMVLLAESDTDLLTLSLEFCKAIYWRS